jgi:diguanylate cyclase (GGDEF)-like protein
MFSTIKSTLTAINSIAIVLVSAAVLAFSIKVHETLYLESVKADFQPLSENISNDLLKFINTEQPDIFGITTTLLRLEGYENVKYAVVLTPTFQTMQFYTGKALAEKAAHDVMTKTDFSAFPKGLSISGNNLSALVHIGEQTLPIGYLLIVNDLEKPLSQSKLDLLSSTLPFVLMVMLIGILVLRWLNTKMLSPFSALARLAKKIKQTNDYTIKINVNGKKEVQALSSEFSSMMETIYGEEVKNKKYTVQLMRQRKDMERLANFDTLTGLPNRLSFMDTLQAQLETALFQRTNPALFYIDLDGFKDVNDTYGHDLGDSLLKHVSKRIRSHLKEHDIVARLGGDEFVVLLVDTLTEQQLKEKADVFIRELSSTFKLDDWEVQVSASIGIAYAKSGDYQVGQVVSNADIAMYRAKLDGKNTYRLFTEDMMEVNRRKLAIANSLSNAIKQDEFTLFYQAKVNHQHQIVGFEALIRWTNDELGFVGPDEFISIAEKSGKIHLITKWVIERCCKDINCLRKLYGENIVLSLNLSSVDLKIPTLADKIVALFKVYDVPAKCMEFEVTESAYLENFDEANAFFERIKKIGCTIALDDFGTGYSSLSYLTQIAIDTLKIDKQFVDKLGVSKRNTLVTKTIIQLAKQLNLMICAEGVETIDQADFLLEAGCNTLQGYYFGKPKPLEALAKEAKELEPNIFQQAL